MQQGLLFWVMGSQASGRDRLLSYAQHILADQPRIRFSQRFIVGQPRAVWDHQITISDFEHKKINKQFSLSWSESTSDTWVGVPSCIDQWLDAGYNVVIAGSRYVFERALARYEDQLIAVYVRRNEDPQPLVNPRENTARIRRRLIGTGPLLESPQLISFNTEFELNTAGDKFIRLIQGRRICA